jgi:hypothetical protein
VPGDYLSIFVDEEEPEVVEEAINELYRSNRQRAEIINRTKLAITDGDVSLIKKLSELELANIKEHGVQPWTPDDLSDMDYKYDLFSANIVPMFIGDLREN